MTEWTPTTPVKQAQKFSIGLAGLPGSGKTQGALELATVLGKKIVVVSTERTGTNWQVDDYKFEQIIWEDVITSNRPFNLEKLIECINALLMKDYDVIIIDMFSDWWEGPGGILDENPNRRMSDWGEVKRRCQPLLDLMKEPPAHIIFTMQAKKWLEQKDVLRPDGTPELDRKGKPRQEVINHGIKPIQRDDMFKPLHLLFLLDEDHTFTMMKDRAKLWRAKLDSGMLTPRYCKAMVEYLDSGVEMETAEPAIFNVRKVIFHDATQETLIVCANEVLVFKGVATDLPLGDVDAKLKAAANQRSPIKLAGRTWDAFTVESYQLMGDGNEG